MCRIVSATLLLVASIEEAFEEHGDWIVELVDYAFFERDNSIIGNVNVFRTDLSAALGDVAETDASLTLQPLHTVSSVERVHLQTGKPYH